MIEIRNHPAIAQAADGSPLFGSDGVPVPGPFVVPPLDPGESYTVNLGNMTFNTRHFFSSVVTFVFSGISIFYALSIDNCKSSFLFSVI